jgi:hypothetical protein
MSSGSQFLAGTGDAASDLPVPISQCIDTGRLAVSGFDATLPASIAHRTAGIYRGTVPPMAKLPSVPAVSVPSFTRLVSTCPRPGAALVGPRPSGYGRGKILNGSPRRHLRRDSTRSISTQFRHPPRTFGCRCMRTVGGPWSPMPMPSALAHSPRVPGCPYATSSLVSTPPACRMASVAQGRPGCRQTVLNPAVVVRFRRGPPQEPDG